jgi:hypothetical protein
MLLLTLGFSFLSAAGKDMQWVKYGINLQKNGNYEKAILAFENAIRLNPENAYAYRYIGAAYLEMKDYDTAVEYFQRAYDIMPTPALKKQIEELDVKVFGEGKFVLYPVKFEVFGGMGMNLSTFMYTSDFSNFFRYGAMVSYHFVPWFDVKTGVIGGWGYDIPVMARFSYRLPWNNRTIAGIGAGAYVNFGAPISFGNDSGVVLAADVRYVIGPVALVGTQMIMYGLAEMPRLSTYTLAGIAF